MHIYLIETEPAAVGLIELLNRERVRLASAHRAYAALSEHAESLFNSMKQSRFDSTGIIELAGFEEARKTTDEERDGIRTLVAQLAPAYNAIAGALLQIAKQGISIAHHGLAASPPGRYIGPETLKNVIWQGRNQSMHYEEGTYSGAVRACFGQLEIAFGSQFSLGTTNRALAVVDLLGWQDFAVYQSDMRSILP